MTLTNWTGCTETEVFEKKRKEGNVAVQKGNAEKFFQAQVRDYAFEKILDRHLYTFKYMLVIPESIWCRKARPSTYFV